MNGRRATLVTMTGTVIWHMTMSLDGFIGDRDDNLDWTSLADGGPSGLGAEVIAG